MEQRISLITLGIADLPRAVNFYERVVGWKPKSSPPRVVLFDLNGLVFALRPHEDMAKDPGMAAEIVPASRGYALAYNARSELEVDGIFTRLETSGATIVKHPHETFWGSYSGYFPDPDGHIWESAHNPFWTILQDGRVSMTKD